MKNDEKSIFFKKLLFEFSIDQTLFFFHVMNFKIW